MKIAIVTALFFLPGITVFAQTNVCGNRLDTAQVIKIAKRHNAYWNINWYAPPAIKFDRKNCTWEVVATKVKHTDRGECKDTNGCTQIKQVTLIIDAETKRVLSKDKTITVSPNYE